MTAVSFPSAGAPGGAPLTVIVDGNNVTRALGITAPQAVEEFLLRLEMAAVTKDWEVTLFFDGPERHQPRETGPLVVRYAKGKSADSMIERMVHEQEDRKRVVVVTHDRAEGNLVLGMGAFVWSPQRLVEEMRSSGIQ